MHDVGCSLILVMGCRSTKHLNSVSDDVAQVEKVMAEDIIIRSSEETTVMENKKHRGGKATNGKTFMSKDLKELGRKNGIRGNSTKFPYSQSQLDFFEMLDKKIMEGNDCPEEINHNDDENDNR